MPPTHSIAAPPSTDIWRKPPSTDIFNAPTLPLPLPSPSKSYEAPIYPLRAFTSARITFTLPPTNALKQYDQAGLLLHLTQPGLAKGGAPKEGKIGRDKWVKAGIEFYNGTPRLSVVCCDRWADWSVAPVPSASSSSPSSGQKEHASKSAGEGKEGEEEEVKATVLAVRQPDALGKGLWVYAIPEGSTDREAWVPLRECCWFFAGEGEEGDAEWVVEPLAYACRPAKAEAEGEAEKLEAGFEEGSVVWEGV